MTGKSCQTSSDRFGLWSCAATAMDHGQAHLNLSHRTIVPGWALLVQSGSGRLPADLKALTHFAILYEKHVERN